MLFGYYNEENTKTNVKKNIEMFSICHLFILKIEWNNVQKYME